MSTNRKGTKMSRYINVGAMINGERPATKKALREALSITPWTVRFDSTSPFEPATSFNTAQIKAGDKLQVTGPDPYERRNWYATVEIVKGEIKVS
jgi:hypothetical protein